MINLLKITKGDWTVMDFLDEVEDQVELNRAEMKRITEDHLTRIALIAGFRDTSLSEKVLAENYNLKTKVQLAVTRENIKAKFWAVQGKSKVKVRRLGGRRKSKHHNGYDRDASSMDSRGNNIDDLQRRLNVLKVKRHSKYSGRYKNESSGKSEGAGGGANAGKKCMNCNLTHHACKCREAGKTCYQCQGVGHYARAPAFSARRGGQERSKRRSSLPSATKKRVENNAETLGSRESLDDSAAVSWLARGKTNMRWPGVKENADTGRLCRVQKTHNNDKGSRWVTVRLLGV